MSSEEEKSSSEPFHIRSVGIVKSEVKNPSLKAGSDNIELDGDLAKMKERSRSRHERVSEVIINEELAGVLDGIEDYSHLNILYWAHRTPESSRDIRKVHPMGRKDNPLTGVFATCSPARPNPILLTSVKLLKREGNVLTVQGLDAVDGSPVIDVKPYVPTYQVKEEVKIPWWMERIFKKLGKE
ncbi:MAG: tRNA (N6-threonylcarbamoyladenosine(37)-N6)-methyltransferase TrmO [bacterium]